MKRDARYETMEQVLTGFIPRDRVSTGTLVRPCTLITILEESGTESEWVSYETVDHSIFRNSDINITSILCFRTPFRGGVAPLWGEQVKNVSMLGCGLTSFPEHTGNVTSLTLACNAIEVIPDDVSTEIQYLNVSHNRIASLPDSIGRLTALKGLSLNDNRLTSLPDALGRLRSLQDLDISSNAITHFPESVGDLLELRNLVFFETHITTLPDSMSRLEKLLYLNLRGVSISSALRFAFNMNNVKLTL